jgi:hypothetical protein
VVKEWNNPELTSAFEQTIQKTEQATTALETGAQRMTRAFNIETFTKTAGSIASLGAAIQQVQNLGSIWKNEDLSTGEKILQTITNLGMTIGMVIPALTNLNKVLKLVTASKASSTTATAAHTTANIAEAGALTATGTAATGAATGVKAFTAALSTNPIFAVITALTALISIFGIVDNIQKQNKENTIKSNQEIIDSEKRKQETLEKNKGFYS